MGPMPSTHCANQCIVSYVAGIWPQVSWLFFKARAKRRYLDHTGRASNAKKQPTGRGPEGCVENGPAAALLVGYVSIQICALLAPCRRPILIATKATLFMGQHTKSASEFADPRCRGSFPAQLEVGTLPNFFDQSGPETRDTFTARESYASVKNSVRPILQKGYRQPLRYSVTMGVMVRDEFAFRRPEIVKFSPEPGDIFPVLDPGLKHTDFS